MELRLERLWPKEAYTIGRLYINNEFFCNTLEDKIVDKNKNGIFDNGEKKVYGESAIPYGTYKIIYNWSPKFGRNLPRLLNVPHFEGILIHSGNTAADSASVLLWLKINVGLLILAITLAMVNVFPDPVTPNKVCAGTP